MHHIRTLSNSGYSGTSLHEICAKFHVYQKARINTSLCASSDFVASNKQCSEPSLPNNTFTLVTQKRNFSIISSLAVNYHLALIEGRSPPSLQYKTKWRKNFCRNSTGPKLNVSKWSKTARSYYWKNVNSLN